MIITWLGSFPGIDCWIQPQGLWASSYQDKPESCYHCSNLSDRADLAVWESSSESPCLRIICSLNTTLITLLLDLKKRTMGTSDHTRILCRKIMAKIQLERVPALHMSYDDTRTLSFDFKWSRSFASSQYHRPPSEILFWGLFLCTKFSSWPRSCRICFSIFPTTPGNWYLGQGQSV